ncbi:hypothetical protein AB6A40_004132 [Gnathostoma spinigerum]|uniref:Secreted protein n=1 Tax=Gnathostoma spinigerum TaxID=75299 RepID=A0ABD6EBK2_9BILA
MTARTSFMLYMVAFISTIVAFSRSAGDMHKEIHFVEPGFKDPCTVCGDALCHFKYIRVNILVECYHRKPPQQFSDDPLEGSGWAPDDELLPVHQ